MQKLSRINTDSKYTRRKLASSSVCTHTERTSHIINRNTGCIHECKHSPDSTTGVPDSSKTAVMSATSRSNISSSTRSCLRYLLDGDRIEQRQPDRESFSRKTNQMCFVVCKLHAQGCRAHGSSPNCGCE